MSNISMRTRTFDPAFPQKRAQKTRFVDPLPQYPWSQLDRWFAQYATTQKQTRLSSVVLSCELAIAAHSLSPRTWV
eukprot:363790-Chlamydomonas_euryale.AAC.9